MNPPTLLPPYLDEAALTSPDVAALFETYLGSQRGEHARERLMDRLKDVDYRIWQRVFGMTEQALLAVALQATGVPSLTEVVCGSPLCLGSGYVLDLDPSPVCGFCHGKGVVKPTTAQVVRADQIATATAEARLFASAA